jgi:hypothetical protein
VARWKDRRVTALERQMMDELADVFEELELDPDDVDWPAIWAVMRDEFFELGKEVAAIWIDTMPAAVADYGSTRTGFEARLRHVWGPALDRLNALIIAAQEAGSAYVVEEHRARRYDVLDEALARCHARSCMIASEIAVLLEAGYPSGAQARWRSLHELAVTSFFLLEHGPDLAERYLLHDVIEHQRALAEHRRHAVALGVAPPTAGEEAEIARQAAALVTRFGPTFKARYGWAAAAIGNADPTFAQIEAATKMEHLRPFVRMSGHAIHAGPTGLYDDLGAEASRGEILLSGASNTGLFRPGAGAAISILQATVALLNASGSAEGLLMVAAMRAFTDETTEAFDRCATEMDHLVRLNWGHIRRREVFARRRKGALRAAVISRRERRRRAGVRLT